MSLIEQLSADVKTAMKARDNQRRDAVRLLLSELKRIEKDKGSELTEQEEIDALSTQAKRRRDSIDAYAKAGREDLQAVEEYELKVIEEYLPAQLTPEEAKAIVAEVVAEVGATSRKQMGQVMKEVMPKLKGRFPGKEVKGLVMDQLS